MSGCGKYKKNRKADPGDNGTIGRLCRPSIQRPRDSESGAVRCVETASSYIISAIKTDGNGTTSAKKATETLSSVHQVGGEGKSTGVSKISVHRVVAVWL